MPLVSAIIPAFNAAQFLCNAIDSALAQTDVSMEVIVVNDGSTDETAGILRQYGGRIRVVEQSNQGAANACNQGVAVAQGEWIAFLDADDEWRLDKTRLQLDRCSGFAISHTDSICHGSGVPAEICRSSFEPPYSGEVLNHLLVTNFITKSSVMMRHAAFTELGGFEQHLQGVEDWPFWLKVCANHPLGYLDKPVVRYRVHQQSKSMQSRKTLADHLRIIQDAFGPRGVGADRPELRRSALASSYQINCHYAAMSGDWQCAIRCAAQALRYAPNVSRNWKNLVKTALLPLGVPY